MEASERIRELKLLALEQQREGNPSEARKLLEEARNLEFASYESLEECLESLVAAQPVTTGAILAKKAQQYAVYLKQKGDLEGAKRALLKSKQLQQAHTTQQQTTPPQPQPTGTTTETASSTTTPQAATATTAPATESSHDEKAPAPMPEDTTPQQPETPEPEAPTGAPDDVSSSPPSSGTPDDTEPTDPPEAGASIPGTAAPPNEQAPDPPPSGDEPKDEKDDTSKQDEKAGATEEEERELRKMMQEEEGGDDDGGEDPTATESIGFTDAEMMDLDMMRDFFAMQQSPGDDDAMVVPLPTLEDYQRKILEYKQAALRFKQAGQRPKALKALQNSKKFQAVHDALRVLLETAPTTTLKDTDDDHQWLEDLSSEENELIRELYAHPTGGGTKKAAAGDTVLDPEDLDEMDAGTLRDALELGMTLPSLDEMRARAEAQKQQALAHKQKGDLPAAKAALVLFKKLQEQTARLEVLTEELAATASSVDPDDEAAIPTPDVSDEALEALLAASEAPKQPAAATTTKPRPPAPAPATTSADLKQEAIRLRDAGRTAEATAVLKKYKEALKAEAAAAERAKIRELVQTELAPRAAAAREQALLFGLYYAPLVHRADGHAQSTAWTDYAKRCDDATAALERHGSATAVRWKAGSRDPSLPVLRSFPSFENGTPGAPAVELLQQAANPTDDRLEVRLLGVSGLESHKAWPKLVRGGGEEDRASKIRAHAHVHLPASEEDPDRPIERWMDSEVVVADPHDSRGAAAIVGFPLPQEEEDHHLLRLFPRDGSNAKFAKTVLRRMERRKIQINLYHTHCEKNPPKKKPSAGLGGWFGGKKKQATLEEDPTKKEGLTLLGKVVLETKDLLEHSCIVGGFPLIGPGKKELGGKLHLCLRTGVPFKSDGIDDGMDALASATVVDAAELEDLNHMLLENLKDHTEQALGFEMAAAPSNTAPKI